jgi:hypothetical protein
MRLLYRAAGAALALALLGVPSTPLADVRPFADFEVGWAVPGYNDVRIPGDSGTKFSLNDDGVATSSAPYARLKLGATFASRHTVFVTGAPLRLQARGTLPSDVSFDGGAYPAGTFVTGQYRFDTWRITYRYAFWSSPRLEATVGLTGLVRDAGISLHGGDVFQEKLNTGVVPLLSFSVLWRFAGPWSLLLDGDALAGGPGRAEDVTIALRRQLGDDLAVRVGYRIVEGGADVAEVYNFALVSFAAAALEVGF